jgi:hypothetical protein
MSQDVTLYSISNLATTQIDPPLTGDDAAAAYLRTYHEWRDIYGLQDSCIDELRLAIMAEGERDSLSVQQRDRLEWLARMIRREQESTVASKLQ